MADIDDTNAMGGGFQRPPSTNTYTGDRGGIAEDEQLLAELRAISMKSSSSSRFAGDDDNEVVAGGSFPASAIPSNDDGHSGGNSSSGNMMNI